jgi:hypothetical protein
MSMVQKIDPDLNFFAAVRIRFQTKSLLPLYQRALPSAGAAAKRKKKTFPSPG